MQSLIKAGMLKKRWEAYLDTLALIGCEMILPKLVLTSTGEILILDLNKTHKKSQYVLLTVIAMLDWF